MPKLTQLELTARARTRLMEERVLIATQRAALRKDIKLKTVFDKVKENLKPVMAMVSDIKPIKAKKNETIYINLADDQYRSAIQDEGHLLSTLKSIEQTVINSKAKHLVLINLGDSVEGSNRATTKVLDDAITQAIDYADVLAAWLTALSKRIKISYYMVTADNHGEVRSLGGPGETPQNNVLNIIAQTLKYVAKGNPNLTVYADHVFYNITLPGGHKVAIAHGNYAVQKRLLKFKTLCGDVKAILFGHLHHNFWKQEIGFDMVIAPSAKKYVVDYEINGGFAEIDHKTNRGFRKAQFQQLFFNEDHRISGVLLHDIK